MKTRQLNIALINRTIIINKTLNNKGTVKMYFKYIGSKSSVKSDTSDT